MSGPTFLVAGAARSGTTALVEGLRTHREVFVTTPKEPHYFAFHDMPVAFTGPGDAATINRIAVTDLASYRGLFTTDPAVTQRGDASVSTMYYHGRAIPEIQRICPDARIVIVLREPVERAHSAFDYMTARGFEPEQDLLDALADERRRIEQGWHHLWHYAAMGLYAGQVAAFLDAFGPDRVKVVYYDHLKADYTGTLSDVLRFLGTSPQQSEGVGVPIVNSSGAARSQVAQRALHAATRIEPLRRAVKKASSFRAREAVRRVLLRPNAVSSEVRAHLQPAYAEDLRALRQMLPPDGQPAWLASER